MKRISSELLSSENQCHVILNYCFHTKSLNSCRTILSHTNHPGTCDEGGLGVLFIWNHKQNGPHCFVLSSIFIDFYLFYLFFYIFLLCLWAELLLHCFLWQKHPRDFKLHWNTVCKHGAFVFSEFKYIFRYLILSHVEEVFSLFRCHWTQNSLMWKMDIVQY